MDCQSPEIPENTELLDGYGDPKAKFQFTVPPPCMAEPREITIPGTKEKQAKWDSPEQKEFIKQEQQRCYTDGYWCWIHGVLTWLPPWYYFFLNYWRVPSAREDGRLEYRDAQRRVLLYLWNVLKFTDDFGVCYLKGRRNFATAIGHAIGYIEATRGRNRKVGLSSSEKDLSEENYLEMMADPIKEMPLWFRPNVEVQAERVLFRDGKRSRDINVMTDDLNSDITMKALTKRGFDGRLLHFLFGDESGKWKKVDVVKWIGRQIKVMTSMTGRIGFAWIPTTAEEIEEGGKEFRKLFEDSDVLTLRDGKYRNTDSMLRSLFIPAYDGWPGWVGPYGESIIEYPDDEQWEYMLSINPKAERIGSKAKLERDIAQALESGNESRAALLRREAPFQPSDAWTGLNANCPYETTILQPLKTITEANMPGWLMEKKVQRGYFDFFDKKTKTQPRWNPSDTGPVYLSWHPNPSTIGQVKKVGGVKVPVNDKIGVLFLDTYSRTDTKEKGSNQGFGGKLFFNKAYEEENRRELQRTGQNMAGYHPTPSIFMYFAHRNHVSGWDHEQVHAACLYFSMPVALENNRSTAFEIYMNGYGMRGFMLKEWEIKGERPTMGQNSNSGNLDRVGIFSGGETMQDGHISMGAQYHNEFLKGNAAHLGDFNYSILDEPIRYPFPQGIQDNLDFDLSDREKSDYSMALNVGSYTEWNVNKYDEYTGISHGEKTKIKTGKLATYYRMVKKFA